MSPYDVTLRCHYVVLPLKFLSSVPFCKTEIAIVCSILRNKKKKISQYKVNLSSYVTLRCHTMSTHGVNLWCHPIMVLHPVVSLCVICDQLEQNLIPIYEK